MIAYYKVSTDTNWTGDTHTHSGTENYKSTTEKKKIMSVYWEYKHGEHNKFWAAKIIEELVEEKIKNAVIKKTRYVLVRRWGKIETEGQMMKQIFDTNQEAQQVLRKLINEKESKGYKPIF
jgi:predicted DNA-binding WGR domain protein